MPLPGRPHVLEADRPGAEDVLSARTAIELATAALNGTLTTVELEDLSSQAWERQTLVQHAESPLPTPTALRRVTYGPLPELRAELLYGAAGQPSCVRVHTPAFSPWTGALDDLPVRLHTHDSAHLTLLLEGRARFLYVRDETLHIIELVPGDIVLYPAGVAHTFRGDEAFVVASIQALHQDTAGPNFAQPAETSAL